MTKSPESVRCGWCHRPLAQSAGAGRPRQFCGPSHRQRAYEARRRAEVLRIPTGHCIVAEEDLRRLHDRLYRLEAAVEDVTSDLCDDARPAAYRRAYEHLLDAAVDLAGMVVVPARE